MKLKKLGAIALTGVMLLGTLAGCGGSGSGSGGDISTINLWISGSDNMRLVYEALEKDFNANEEYNEGKYQLKVQYVASGGGGQTMRDRIVAAYKAGQTSTDMDLVEMNDEDLSVILGAGDDILLDYDASLLPNLAGVEARPAEGEGKAVPYRGTTVIMAYNSETVPNPPKTVDELTLWIKDNPGKFSYNSAGTGGAGDSFIRSSIYNFIDDEAFMSSDEKWISEWDAGFDYLKEIHPYTYQSSGKVVYPNKNQGVLDLLNDREIDMCPAWADQVLSSVGNGTLPESIKIYQIEPGLTGAIATFGIPKMTSNAEGAHAVINYMLSVEAQTILLEQLQAIPLIDLSLLDESAAEGIKDLDVSNFRTQSIGDLGVILNQRWNEEIATIG